MESATFSEPGAEDFRLCLLECKHAELSLKCLFVRSYAKLCKIMRLAKYSKKNRDHILSLMNIVGVRYHASLMRTVKIGRQKSRGSLTRASARADSASLDWRRICSVIRGRTLPRDTPRDTRPRDGGVTP